MARTDNLTNFLSDVADSIREKSGESSLIQASEFDNAIRNIPSGGGDNELPYGGKNPELIYEMDVTFSLADTDIVPSSITGTTTKNYRGTTPLNFTIRGLNFKEYDYVFFRKARIVPSYEITPTGNYFNQTLSTALTNYNAVEEIYGSKDNNEKVAFNTELINLVDWTTPSENRREWQQAQAGINMTFQSVTSSGTNIESMTVSCNKPTLRVTGNTTFNTLASQQSITDCNFNYVVKAYRVDKGSSVLAKMLKDTFPEEGE